MRTFTVMLTWFLIADILHRASHAPWRCGDDCPWPWGKRTGIEGLVEVSRE